MIELLSLARSGGELPAVSRPAADAAHRLLVGHVQHQIEARLRMARYILGQ